MAVLRKRKLRDQQLPPPAPVKADAAEDGLEDPTTLEELFKKNGAALAMKCDPKLKEDDLQKLLRKEFNKKERERRRDDPPLLPIQAGRPGHL